MAGRITEIYRNCRFRWLSVTEIHRSPYRGAVVFGGHWRGLAVLNCSPWNLPEKSPFPCSKSAAPEFVGELLRGIK